MLFTKQKVEIKAEHTKFGGLNWLTTKNLGSHIANKSCKRLYFCNSWYNKDKSRDNFGISPGHKMHNAYHRYWYKGVLKNQIYVRYIFKPNSNEWYDYWN